MCFTVALNALTVLCHAFLSLAQFLNQYKEMTEHDPSSEKAAPYD